MIYLSLYYTGAAMITLPPPYCAVCSPINAICSLLNSWGSEQLGYELEVVVLVCVYVCMCAHIRTFEHRTEEEGVGSILKTASSLINSLLCASFSLAHRLWAALRCARIAHGYCLHISQTWMEARSCMAPCQDT